MSKRFHNFLEHKGIIYKVAYPRTPQQNGIAKRKHRHIVGTTITLMIAAGLSQDLWFHVCVHFVFF